MARRQKSVALLIETSNAYGRGLLEGIVQYMQSHQTWSIYLPEQGRGDRPPAWLKQWRGDGFIVRIENPEIAAVVRGLKIPVVDVSAARQIRGIPWVETNDEAIAALAAEHFLERGLRHLAYCGDPDFNWSCWRRDAFVEHVGAAGTECILFESRSRRTPHYSARRERTRLTRWLLRLPRPVGIFACYDIRAQQILDICREHRVRVPEDMALLGVDNDELLCQLCAPPLSSIVPGAQRAGREAARLLDGLMHGESVREESVLVDPVGIVTRQSTDILAIEDHDIAEALTFIRAHACEGIRVSDVLAAVPLSRRKLEHRFLSLVGRTPHQEIVRRRVERICELLRETDLPLVRIAQRTGFRNEEYMSVLFRRETGETPGEYRRRN